MAKTFLPARYHQGGSLSLGSRVHPLMLCSEVTVRKDEHFCRPSQSFCFVVFRFMAGFAHTYLRGLLTKDSCIRIVVPTLRSRSVIFLL